MGFFRKKKRTAEEKAFKANNKNSSKYINILRKAEDVAIEVLERVDKIDLKTHDFIEVTKSLKAKLSDGAPLDSILIDAFVNAYLGIEKIYNISLYKVQIMGGYVLNLGDIAEMKTGEGKTLTAILPAYLNALLGNGVHIVTVNEYLSQRDSFNTGKVFSLLGLKTGSVTAEQTPPEKQIEYNKDITYITNSELGFDYLKDNMVNDIKQKTQRGFPFAIVDEVDSILIDEARTPLIISQGAQISADTYNQADEFVKTLIDEDYIKDEEAKSVFLTDSGVKKAEEFFALKNLYSFENSELVHRIFNALQANYQFTFDIDYTVKDDEIVLIDIFTGRLLPGRSFSEGLNQAIEAKEGVKIKPETKVIASITYQNLFRMYSKLSGMTGTAATEEEELISIYNMRVVSIPTNLPVIRKDAPDLIFASKVAKFENTINKIRELHEKGQPVLVGTKSVSDSESLAKQLDDFDLPYEVLNAKNNAREADIIANAGQKGAITISTNMAGRGTDIKLGEGVIELGGLFVIGTERYESRRIDDQLRGRSGRQGDIGYSQFFVSLEDDIMLRAGLKRIQKIMGGLDKDPIASKFITKSITISQKKIEGLNYDQRKNVVEYDDVLNRQRLIVYSQRDNILKSNNIYRMFRSFIKAFAKNLLETENVLEDDTYSVIKLKEYLKDGVLNGEEINFDKLDNFSEKAEIVNWISETIISIFDKAIENQDKDEITGIIKRNMISIIDTNWQEQIDNLTRLRSGIHYRQYAQQNPIQVYILESNEIFTDFKWNILEQIVTISLNFVKHFGSRVVKTKSKETIPSSKTDNVKELIVG